MVYNANLSFMFLMNCDVNFGSSTVHRELTATKLEIENSDKKRCSTWDRKAVYRPFKFVDKLKTWDGDSAELLGKD